MTPSGEKAVKERFSPEFNNEGTHPLIEIENGAWGLCFSFIWSAPATKYQGEP